MRSKEERVEGTYPSIMIKEHLKPEAAVEERSRNNTWRGACDALRCVASCAACVVASRRTHHTTSGPLPSKTERCLGMYPSLCVELLMVFGAR